MQAEISFSESAAIKVKRLIENDGDDSLKLRVFITGGGCNGFSYGFTFDSEVAEDDAMVEARGRDYAGRFYELPLPRRRTGGLR